MAVAVPPVDEGVEPVDEVVELVAPPEEAEAGQPQQPCQQPQQPSQDSGFFEPDCPHKRSLTDDEVAIITSLAEKMGDDASRKRRERIETRRMERARLRDAFYATAPIAAAVAKKRNELKKKDSDKKDE